MDNAQIIWNYLKKQGFNDYGIAGIMGNLYAESALQPDNLQNTANTKLKMTDKQYTDTVDNGTYTNFINDGAGYGLAQWTYNTLKKELYDTCKKNKASIADINSQLECLCNQLKRYNILDTLKQAKSVKDASNLFLTKFERPKDQSNSVKNKRIEYGMKYYNQYKGGTKMKYSLLNPPMVCMATQSACYKQGGKMKILGVLWHSTGANNTTLKRYVQPSNNDPNRDALIAKIGKNPNNNHENRAASQIGLNAWIGTLADGSVAAIQTMPWDYTPWGCGAGSRGSCNNGWIQFEICEDNLSNKTYFDKVYKEACELTAYLCKLYNLDPKGTVSFKGVNVPVILCHKDSANLGLGSNHADVLHWFPKFGKNMDTVRNDVAALLGDNSSTPVNPTPVNPSFVNIQYGDEGSRVEDLQKKLISLGYSCGSWGADGDFGNDTRSAVMKFQSDNNLTPDGIVGESTWNAITKAIENKNKPTPVVSDEIYRVRKSWADVKSQIGAFKNLDNAKAMCNAAGNGYKVFNSAGKEVYPNQDTTPVTPTPTPSQPDAPVTPATKYKDVMLGSASHDERGQYRSGQAGDQTGTEVAVQNWYSWSWDTVLRPKTNALAEKIAVASERACGNKAIGYDQYQRNTLLTEAKKVGMDLAKITTPCECDCSSLVSTCCVCAGLPESIFFAGGNGCTTWTMEQACVKSGQFEVLKANKYIKQKDYLMRGDILLKTDMHVVIVLSDGSKAEGRSSSSAPSTDTKFPYIVKVNTDILNVRSGPGANYPVKTRVTRNYKYTIVEESEGWGRLKSGAGWIDLSYTVKA